MSPGTIQSIATPLATIAFLAVVWWAYGSKQRGKEFDDVANSLFDEDEAAMNQRTIEKQETQS